MPQAELGTRDFAPGGEVGRRMLLEVSPGACREECAFIREVAIDREPAHPGTSCDGRDRRRWTPDGIVESDRGIDDAPLRVCFTCCPSTLDISTGQCVLAFDITMCHVILTQAVNSSKVAVYSHDSLLCDKPR